MALQFIDTNIINVKCKVGYSLPLLVIHNGVWRLNNNTINIWNHRVVKNVSGSFRKEQQIYYYTWGYLLIGYFYNHFLQIMESCVITKSTIDPMPSIQNFSSRYLVRTCWFAPCMSKVLKYHDLCRNIPSVNGKMRM